GHHVGLELHAVVRERAQGYTRKASPDGRVDHLPRLARAKLERSPQRSSKRCLLATAPAGKCRAVAEQEGTLDRLAACDRRLRPAPAPAVDDDGHPVPELVAESRRVPITRPRVIGAVLI